MQSHEIHSLETYTQYLVSLQVFNPEGPGKLQAAHFSSSLLCFLCGSFRRLLPHNEESVTTTAATLCCTRWSGYKIAFDAVSMDAHDWKQSNSSCIRCVAVSYANRTQLIFTRILVVVSSSSSALLLIIPITYTRLCWRRCRSLPFVQFGFFLFYRQAAMLVIRSHLMFVSVFVVTFSFPQDQQQPFSSWLMKGVSYLCIILCVSRHQSIKTL